jgi:uroporphyrinogen decarboxylase
MNSMERVQAAINFEKPDRVPVIAQVFGHAATLAGVGLDTYLCRGEVLADCQLQSLAFYGHDAVFALMDVCVETEAIGSVLDYRADRYPVITVYAADRVDPDKLALPDPLCTARMPELLKAIRILRNAVGDTVPVVGCVTGPMTLAVQLLGMEKALYLAIDFPEQFSRLLDFATTVITDFGKAQLASGAHLPIVFDPASSPDVIPAQFYREFVLPRIRLIFTAFKQAGSLINWLHTAGPVQPILPFYPEAGVELANIDYSVRPSDVMKMLPQTCVNGNIKPLLFTDPSFEEIFLESSRLIRAFAERGGFILSSGCEIPLESKPDNITAMVRAARMGGNPCPF